MVENRKYWIDELRGLAMYFVVLGHLLPNCTIYHVITGPIKMPLFYFLTGYLIKDNKSIKEFAKKNLFRLGMPYLFFSCIPLIIIWYIFNSDIVNLKRFFLELIYGQNFLWFIPSFFITQCIFFVLLKKVHCDKKFFFFSIILFILGICLTDINATYLCINTALTGVLFMNMGLLYKKYESKISKCDEKIFIVGSIIFIICVFISLVFFPNKTIDFHMTKYYNIPFCIFFSLVGIITIIAIFKKIQHKKWLMPIVILGQNTILVYLLHMRFFSVIKRIIAIDYQNYMFIFIESVIACFIGIMISKFCKKYIPWCIGLLKKES